MVKRLVGVFVLCLVFVCGCEPGFFISLLVYQYQQEKKNRLRIKTKSLPDGVLNQQYSVYLRATGGEKPYKWSITDGRLPLDLTLNGDTGLISGLPKEAGLFAFTVKVEDAKGDTASRQFSFTVQSEGQSTYTLTVISNYGEPVPGEGANEIAAGIEITATCGPNPYPGPDPNSGTRYKCVGFNGSGSGLPANSTDTSVTFTISEDCSITWLWEVQHRLDVTVEPFYGGRVSISGPGSDAPYYTQGDKVTLTANPATGFVFVGWVVNGGEENANPLDISMDAPIEVVAVFRSTTLFVDATNGDDSNNGYTKYTPFATIGKALSQAYDGDTIVVSDGTYYEHDLDFAGKEVHLKSSGGAGNCTIDCEGAGRAFWFHNGEGQNSIVEGFIIKNGSASSGGAVLCEGASPTLRSCIFVDNNASQSGGAVAASNSNLTIENCLFAANSAGLGGAISLSNSNVTVVSCTISRNSATTGGGIYVGTTSQVDVANTIIWSNNATADGAALYIVAGSNVEFTNCDVRQTEIAGNGTYNTTGCISSNPLFYAPLNGDFHLRGNSPCIDAGDNSFTTWSYDLDGRKRIWDGNGDSTATVDIGCYEGAWHTVSPLVGQTIQDAIDSAFDGDVIVLKSGTYSGAGNYDLDTKGKAILIFGKEGADSTIIDCNQQGRGFIFQRGETEDTVIFGVTIRNGKVSGNNGGGITIVNSSPQIAGCIIENCVAESAGGGGCGGGVMIAGGSPQLLYSVIKDCDAAQGGGAYVYNASATFIAVQFQSCSAQWGAGCLCATNASATFEFCVFTSNDASGAGGGVEFYQSADSEMRNCAFISNNAGQSGGGVVTAGCNLTLAGCLVVGNSATVSGGGLRCGDGTLTLINCTVASNTTKGGGGGLLITTNGTVIVKNSIIWGNAADGDGDQAYSEDSSASLDLSFCDFPNSKSDFAGDGSLSYSHCIHKAPRFNGADDFHLRSTSPCIDAGSNNEVPSSLDCDLDGKRRIIDGNSDSNPVVDMGCYEYQ